MGATEIFRIMIPGAVVSVPQTTQQSFYHWTFAAGDDIVFLRMRIWTLQNSAIYYLFYTFSEHTDKRHQELRTIFKTKKAPQDRQKRFLGSQMGDFECFLRFWNLGIFPALLRKIFFRKKYFFKNRLVALCSQHATQNRNINTTALMRKSFSIFRIDFG